MKTYPSIGGPASGHKKPMTAFFKYDGSNIRVEFDRKKGFCKFGTKKNMFDETNEWFGPAIPLFHEMWGEKLESLIRKDKHLKTFQKITFFFEYFGEKSFAGWHDVADPKTLVLFDVNPLKKGFMCPKEFLDYFGHFENIAEVVYEGNYNEPFVKSIMQNDPPLISKLAIKQPIPEGVVCKGGEKHNLWACKVKTAIWKEELKKRHPEDWEELM